MTQKHLFPAGRYFIGDPCYAVANTKWDELIKNTGCFGYEEGNHVTNWYDGVFYHNGKKCFAWGTAHGDGVYKDNKKGRYGVDAGLIGIVPFDAVDEEDNSIWGGHCYTFKEIFQVWEDGRVFHFGDITINTN